MSFTDILRVAMPVVYMCAGAVLLFTDLLSGTISQYRPALGGVLLGYGLLRAFLWWGTKRRKPVDDGVPHA